MQDITVLVEGLLGPVVKHALAQALAEHEQERGPEPLWDRQAVGQFIGASLPKVDALVGEGMPSLMIGGSRRFEPDAVRAWLRTRKGAP